jgi:hypothetical protein
MDEVSLLCLRPSQFRLKNCWALTNLQDFIYRSQSIRAIMRSLRWHLRGCKKIGTALVPPNHKARWLIFWKSSIHTREPLHFPAKGFKTDERESWLNKAPFWAGVRYYYPSFIHLAFCFTTLFENDLLTPTLWSSIKLCITCILSFFLCPCSIIS